MGSLKDEMRGLREDHQSCVKMDDGGRPEGSDCSAAPEGPQLHTSQESTTQEDCQTKLSKSKDQGLSGVDCGNTADCKQTDAMPLISEAAATQSNATSSVNIMVEGDTEIHSGKSDADPDREKVADIENILVPVPSTPDPTDPRSPAPLGQQHMRTQVSLEVVQCHSAATSPMTPPEGGNSFFFPSSFGNCGAVGTDTKDAELQVGQQVEFCSVATSPMTPKTPWTTAFPELIGKEEKLKKSEEQSKSFPETKRTAEAETTDALKCTSSKELTEGLGASVSLESSPNCLAAGLRDSHLEGTDQHCKQQRMGSMDQDITILVTQHGNNGEEEEDKSFFYSVEPEMVKIDEYEENKIDVMSTETAPPDPAQDASKTNQQSKSEDSSTPAGEEPKTCREAGNSGIKENKDVHEEPRDFSVIKSPVPESPAPFGCHNIRTQVSLEVVQCQSAATSPMTPPEGDHAFCFPSTFGKCGAVGAETKDAELQVGQQVEFRSVATAPMTPRTPTATTFPDIKKETSIEEKIEEEEEDKKEQKEVEAKEEVQNEEEKVTEEENVQAAKEEQKEETNVEEKCEEPVQEVSWDEKGMTWEVYGAVVEVAVLGSAIQKHLEKQVKKQKRQSNLPPPPPLNPSATPLASGSGSGKGRSAKRGEQDGKVSRRRRNPFRLLMENVQQPHCCSRAHTAE